MLFAILALISLVMGGFFAVLLAHDIVTHFNARHRLVDIAIDLALIFGIGCILIASAHDALSAIYPVVVCGVTGF